MGSAAGDYDRRDHAHPLKATRLAPEDA